MKTSILHNLKVRLLDRMAAEQDQAKKRVLLAKIRAIEARQAAL